MTTPDADDPGQHLTTKEGWRRFTLGRPEAPQLPAPEQYALLAEPIRRNYDEIRIDHHARLMVVATSTVRHTVTTGRRLVMLNRHAISARRGLIVSGPAGTGKTIAVTQLGLAHELGDRAVHHGAHGRIPVLYATVPPAATARMIAAEFARFLGLPIHRRLNTADIIESVVGVCTKVRTGLVIVDEVHNISLATRQGAEVSDTLKYFSERIPATFVYAGIDIEHSTILQGTRGAQIAGRFTLIPTHPFPYGEEWKGLVKTMEATLLLHRHKPGTLAGLDHYLHERTGGMIGALSHQIRGAAIDAILTGDEEVTRSGLEAVPLDFTATNQHRKKRKNDE
ncbi:TniB family NTP-binding protein [Kitasatospora sp. YST-16]|uniref:TniB family NTP-binding protein n=1 Tax=Kitasatospora sp. YST-16 TaxID=2998080 RepID=UPI002283DE34|nr:TniB family NTP-binding protein [Kitasatospora sp. YST-16]WAL75854.1 TniB family NTP-binding protein [Kitasatospora sp. YST-16]WNW41915.1 TniB family NTP-binding protein [Streptomyces sp. Li-HN-5-13]